MTETQRIADQLHRAYAGSAWHGPALRQLLRGVSAKQAAARPVRGAHTIWELVLHITAWKRAVLRRMQGKATSLSPAKNFPPMPRATPANWKKTQDALRAAQYDLHRAISGLPESRLKKIVPGKRYSVYFMLHGLVQHDLYHAGQMALLKKMRRR